MVRYWEVELCALGFRDLDFKLHVLLGYLKSRLPDHGTRILNRNTEHRPAITAP